MIQNRYFRHTLFVLSIMGLLAVIPPVSEAHIDIVEPTEISNINLSLQPNVEDIPYVIVIPSRNIELNVQFSKINNGTWEVPEYSAGFAEGSSFLDEEHGNSIIFAHARSGLFRELLGINMEDEITVIGNKNLYKYRVASIEKILPDEIDKIKSAGDHNLTLFTCEGWNDEYRLLVKAIRTDIYSFPNSSEII